MLREFFGAGLMVCTFAAPLWAEGDVEKGEKVFRRCAACHKVGPEAKSQAGPSLNGIVGAAAAANPDFKYSTAMQAKADEGLVWDEATLATFLLKPREFVKGTKMSFAGLRKEQEAIDIIAYLATFQADGSN